MTKDVCYNEKCPWYNKNCSHDLLKNNLNICIETKRQNKRNGIASEKELWEQVIQDCQWFDKTNDNVNILINHFKSMGFKLSKE